MKYIFKLEIDVNPNFDKIKFESIIKLKGILKHNEWVYNFTINHDDEWFDFYNYLNTHLYKNFDKINSIGIYKEDITIWLYYEYDGQCNLEFNSNTLKMISNFSDTFCISCWNSEIDEVVKKQSI